MDYDPAQDWARVKVLALDVLGELDTRVDVSQNRPALATANHLFQDAKTGSPNEYALLPMQFMPGFLEAIGGWLTQRLARG